MSTERERIRSRRAGWARRGETALTKRDLDILYLAGVCGVVRTRDVTRFAFGARATANDRLRKLYCAGFIECFVPTLSGDNHYTLTARGREQLVEAFGLSADDVRVVRKLPRKLEHGLAITEVRLHVALACRASPRYALDAFDTDADLAAARHAALLDLIPDARVLISHRATGAVDALMVEVDLGTEPVTWLARHKLALYARHAALGTALYGVTNPLVVLVVPSLRRARTISRTLVAERHVVRLVFALRGMLSEVNVLGSAYARPSDIVSAAADASADELFRTRLLP